MSSTWTYMKNTNVLLEILVWVCPLNAENRQGGYWCPPQWCHTDAKSWMLNRMKMKYFLYKKDKKPCRDKKIWIPKSQIQLNYRIISHMKMSEASNNQLPFLRRICIVSLREWLENITIDEPKKNFNTAGQQEKPSDQIDNSNKIRKKMQRNVRKPTAVTFVF